MSTYRYVYDIHQGGGVGDGCGGGSGGGGGGGCGGGSGGGRSGDGFRCDCYDNAG